MGIWCVKRWMLLVTIWLGLYTSYISSCYHHLHHPCSNKIRNGFDLLGLSWKMPIKNSAVTYIHIDIYIRIYVRRPKWVFISDSMNVNVLKQRKTTRQTVLWCLLILCRKNLCLSVLNDGVVSKLTSVHFFKLIHRSVAPTSARIRQWNSAWQHMFVWGHSAATPRHKARSLRCQISGTVVRKLVTTCGKHVSTDSGTPLSKWAGPQRSQL